MASKDKGEKTMITKDKAKELAIEALEKRLDETSRLYKDACQAIQAGVDDGRFATVVRLNEAQARDYKENTVNSEAHEVATLLTYLGYQVETDSARMKIFWRY